MRSIDDLSEELGGLKGKRVLVRSDLNVPLDKESGAVTDDGRIRASLPTWKRLLDAGAKVIVGAHLGRPKGEPDPRYSLQPAAARACELLPTVSITLAEDTVGESARAAVAAMADGELVMLENLRFNPGETSKDDAERGAFADELAALADGFVSDGFGVVHRRQASVYDVAQRLPHAAGGLVLAEVEVLKKLTEDVKRPYVVVLGGSKVSDKLGVIDNLLGTADKLLIGGGMAFTFLAAQGHEVGKSLLEADQIETVKGSRARAETAGGEGGLPGDSGAAEACAADAAHSIVAADGIPADRMGLDIGPESSQLFVAKLEGAATVFWNGPMGVFELQPFSHGTAAVAEALTASSGFTVVGGGDSAAAVRTLGFDESAFGHISTGGGASLEFLEGKTLPGLSVLEN